MDLCVDARAVYDAISASDACEPAGNSLELHLISVGDRMTHGLVRKFSWVDTRDMPADGLTEGGIDRFLLRSVSNDCKHDAKHRPPIHTKVGSATSPPGKNPEVGFEHRTDQVGFEHRNVEEDLEDQSSLNNRRIITKSPPIITQPSVAVV